MEKGMKLCGGTFFSLLLEKKKNRKITNPTCLQALVDVFHITVDSFEDSTYTSHTSSYKTCELNHSEWLVFDNEDYVKAFSDRIYNPSQYKEIVKDMEGLVADCLSANEDKQAELVHEILELIDADDTIPDNAAFYIMRDGKSVLKKQLITTAPKLYFPSFLVGVWHYIIENVYDNTAGKDTLVKWNGKREKHKKGKIQRSVFDGRFSSVIVEPFVAEPSNKKKSDAAEDSAVSDFKEEVPKKKLTPLEEGILASGQAMADVLIPAIKSIENSFGKRLLYASSVITEEEELKYRQDDFISMDVVEHFDPNNKRLIYRYSGRVYFERKLDEFMNQNIVVSAVIDEVRIVSYTTYDNWKSKSYANNVLSDGYLDCKIMFKVLSVKDDNVCQVQVILIEDL